MLLTAMQMTSVPDVSENLAQIERLLQQHQQTFDTQSEHLVVLPECCLYFGGSDKQQSQIAEPLSDAADNCMQTQLAALARQYQCFLLAGSVPVKSPLANKFYANSLLYSPDGKLIADYQKLHLFDVNVDDGTRQYRESNLTEAGTKLSCVNIAGIQVGLAICYDLRFPELFRAYRQLGAKVICVPSAFTRVTGEAHWFALLKARAIENQVYIVAAAQQGVHANGRETFGHAMIVDPWGECTVFAGAGEGFASLQFDADFLETVRRNIPVNEHNRFIVDLKSD
ncbi:carbon-nitrogen hydrolase family protein [Thalassotalea sp. PS06]|uniref:carbon-nitrogen hydrolase family protein n=1 Tax=Thalassotalea sp. PS06 TaxID=2594005 RepID=UPI00116219D4|nr:carbon-nitrogen hydrolase family protein [Thalassotalea sp. PS06]QDP00291.1 carbon-nitrogen hydrolase family protein [Thalassotalea sp. PS06]